MQKSTRHVLVFKIWLQHAVVLLESARSAFLARERNIWTGAFVHLISFSYGIKICLDHLHGPRDVSWIVYSKYSSYVPKGATSPLCTSICLMVPHSTSEFSRHFVGTSSPSIKPGKCWQTFLSSSVYTR